MKKCSPICYLKIATLLAVSLVTACIHTFQDPNEYHAVPSKDMELVTKVPLAKLKEGHAIYKVQCSKCHEPKFPGAVPSDQWHIIIPGMAWNAGLSKDEEKKLNTYIIAACRFIEKEDEH